MARLYQVSLRLHDLPTDEGMARVKAQFDEVGDWLKFTPYSWLVLTEYNPTQIRDILRRGLEPNDHLLVIEATLTGADGWALPWVWDWIRKKRS